MSTNCFNCPKCKKQTSHVSVSYSEALAVEANEYKTPSLLRGGILFIGGLADYTGMTKLVGSVSGRNFWKCCGCNCVSLRKADGEVINYY